MLKDLGIISEWMEESEARGFTEGRSEEARSMLRRVLERRFDPVPAVLEERIAVAEPEWCYALLDRALTLESFEELQAGL